MLMQGLNEMGGSDAPATSHKSGYRKYMPTLAAFTMPAIAAGMAAALIYADAKPRNGAQIDLVTRAQMVRLAAEKIPTMIGPGASLTRANAEHLPLDDVSMAATADVELATQ